MDENNKNIETTQNENEETKMYTQDEVDALLQSEVDRRITSAMKKAEKKKEMAVKEAERLAKMSEQERYEENLRKKEKELEEKAERLALMENKASASQALADRGISIALVDLVLAADADQMLDNIKKLEDEFKKSVNEEVKKKLGSNAPARSSEDSGEMTKENFKKLPIHRQVELMEQNPEKYEKFL